MLGRNFFLLWQGAVVSQIGSQLFSLALLYWLLETTGSASTMGLVLMAASLPAALLSPIMGALADLVDRKRLVVWSDVIRGIVGVILAAAVWLGSPSVALAALFICQIVAGLSGAAFNTAVSALMPTIVGKVQLPRANAILQGSNSFTATVSYGFGGYLFALVGAPWLFLINGVSYLLSALSECFIRLQPQRPESDIGQSNDWRRGFGKRLLSNTQAGLRYVWAEPGLRALVGLLALTNFILVPTSIALPIYVRDLLKQGPDFLGLMGASQAAGGLLGFLLAGVLKVPAHRRSLVVLGSLVGIALVLMALGAVPTLWLTLLLSLLFGALVPLHNVQVISLLQGTTPDRFRGRVMGVLSTMILGLIPISQGMSGLLIDLIGQQVQWVYVSVGVGIIIAVGFACASTHLRDYLRQDLTPTTTQA